LCPQEVPRNTAQPLSALAPSRIDARDISEPPKNGTTSGCPPPSQHQSYRSSLRAQYKEWGRGATGRTFLEGCCTNSTHAVLEGRSRCRDEARHSELGHLKSAACGSPPCRAYRRQRSCGRVAEGGGLLNRYRVVKPYRGFESLRLRHIAVYLFEIIRFYKRHRLKRTFQRTFKKQRPSFSQTVRRFAWDLRRGVRRRR
jgi:hypothetical protein